MTRRDAIKAGIGGLFATLLNWPTTNRINMLQFCGGSYRWDTAKPFEQNGWAYATDCKVCVRTNQLDDATEAGDMRFPPAFKLGWDSKAWEDKGFVVLPKPHLAGWRNGPCYECEMETKCNCEYGCDKCNWIGYHETRCHNCINGNPLSACLVQGQKMDVKIYRKLMTLPNAEIKLVYDTLPKNSTYSRFKPAPEFLVRFNGGQAAVIGLAEAIE